ncbi:MAG: hypothetical protein JWQ50_764 [Caballeronia mineralivorans]|jgi:hypothetical protein|nr:hypothetical protein [Caballeronia mineralivorans]MEA3102613.1 hypothetical protein [Caballeronia mineralivorans]
MNQLTHLPYDLSLQRLGPARRDGNGQLNADISPLV